MAYLDQRRLRFFCHARRGVRCRPSQNFRRLRIANFAESLHGAFLNEGIRGFTDQSAQRFHRLALASLAQNPCCPNGRVRLRMIECGDEFLTKSARF